MTKKIHKILLSPWAILTGLILGITIALINKQWAIAIAPLGQIYLNLIQMLVLPIMITAVISSFGNMFHSDSIKLYLKYLFWVFAISLVGACVVAMIIAAIGQPGANVNEAARLVLSQNIQQMQNQMPLPPDISGVNGFWQFLNSLVPFNIFTSIDQNNMLGVLFFCILLGIGLGQIRTHATQVTILMLEGVFSALLKMISWIMYGMPFGLCFLFAGYVAKMGFAEVEALGRLILLFYFTIFIFAVINSLIVWRTIGGNYFASVRALKNPLLIAFGTSSSFAAIPSMLESLQKNFKLDKNITDAVVPLGVNLNRQGSLALLIFCVFFTAQLFNQPVTFLHVIIIFVIAIFASIASPGVPGYASLGTAALLLQPLGLPPAVGIVLLAAIIPIIDPPLTLANVYGNCVAAILMAKRKK